MRYDDPGRKLQWILVFAPNRRRRGHLSNARLSVKLTAAVQVPVGAYCARSLPTWTSRCAMATRRSGGLLMAYDARQHHVMVAARLALKAVLYWNSACKFLVCSG